MLVSFNELMAEAKRGQYAVGYFESWNMESLQAVADAAETMRSPVILGFSGIHLSNIKRLSYNHFGSYASLGIEMCRQISVPSCLIFNECPDFEMVLSAIDLGFGIVMYSDDDIGYNDQIDSIHQIVNKAHPAFVAVEGEPSSVPGVDGDLFTTPEDLHFTDPQIACEFIDRTNIDAIAVNVGQAHLHGRSEIRLNLKRLAELEKVISIPMVLHGASSLCRADIKEAIKLGVRKINVGSVLKRTYLNSIHQACDKIGNDYNPYEVVGSGLDNDILNIGKIAMQKVVEDMMGLFNSAGKA
jgi:ketose-bisphosphate aldolase